MARHCAIPACDIHLVSELLEGMTSKEVAEKWDDNGVGMRCFLERHKLSINKLRRDFRLKFIKDNPSMKAKELAQHFGCGVCNVRIILRGIMNSEFDKCTTTTKSPEGGVGIDCKLGLWGVYGHSEKQLRAEAMHYFKQYKSDGEYSSIIGGESVMDKLTKG